MLPNSCAGPLPIVIFIGPTGQEHDLDIFSGETALGKDGQKEAIQEFFEHYEVGLDLS
jgi:hypothetical protein